MKYACFILLFAFIQHDLTAQEYFEFTAIVAFSSTSLLVGSGENAFDGATLITRTTDNGATWQTFPFPAKLQKLTFPDSTTGYAIGRLDNMDSSRFQLYKSSDGGATWNVILSGPNYSASRW